MVRILRLALICAFFMLAQHTISAQQQFLQKVLLQSGDSVAINFSEVRYATANGTGALIAYGKPTSAYYAASSLSSIVAASCGNLVSLTEFTSSGTQVVAINPKFVKSSSAVAGETKTRLFLDGSPDRRIVSGSFSYVSGLLGACASGGGGGGNALTTNPLSQFAATTSAQLASVISNETGTGLLVYGTSPTLVTPALGTPTALVGTNITGTAAGLTAGAVTTNANLAGPITSVGNTTAVAAQTGTGSIFAMSASPTFTGTLAITGNEAITPSANTIPLTVSGYSLTGSNASSLLDLSGTWNTSGTPVGLLFNVTNTASNASSQLIDLRVGGSSKFKVGLTGNVTLPNNATIFAANSSGFNFDNNSRIIYACNQVNGSTQGHYFTSNSSCVIGSGTGSFMFLPQTFDPTSGSGVYNALNIVTTVNQTGGATGVSRSVYINPTLTASADHRALETGNGKVVFADTYSAGSGSLAGSVLGVSQTWNTSGTPTAVKLNVTNTASNSASLLMDLQVGGSSAFKVDVAGRVITNNVVRLKGYTVATLPAGTVGDMAYVTDALAPTYGAALVGGGSVVTPCFYDGTAWTSR